MHCSIMCRIYFSSMSIDDELLHYAAQFRSSLATLDNSIVIYIAGIYGVGKTTLSYNLSLYTGIKQRASLGVITKTLQILNKKRSYIRNMDKLSEDSNDFRSFNLFSKKVCHILNHIVDVAHADGVNYIIDGVQLTPKYLQIQPNHIYIFIKSPRNDSFKKLLNFSSTHPKRYRNVNIDKIKILKQLERHILKDTTDKDNIKVLKFTDGEQEMTLNVLKLLVHWLHSSGK